MKEQMDRLGIEDAMVQRYVNQGFSGGEKKRNGCSSWRSSSRRCLILWTRRTPDSTSTP